MKKFKNKDNLRRYKNIIITNENYDRLKKLGNTGDSFNFVITQLLNKTLQSGDGVGDFNQIVMR
jgi:hypothetical protein